MNIEDQPPIIPIGTLRGRGHTLPAKTVPEAVPDAELSSTLPAGVMSSRMAAMRDERIVTAKTIIDLEKQVIDVMNSMIRVRNILSEITRGMPSLQKWQLVQEALKEIE